MFIRVLRGLLRPLVRVLIAQGVTAPAFYRMLKQLYVEVAERDFSLPGERATDSRISLLTGVHRRDVHDFRDPDRSAEESAGEKVTTMATVIGRWLADPALSGPDGQPAPLPRSASEGPSFEALVASVSKDIRPRTVLDELERQGLVEQRDDLVHLHANAFLGPADPDQRLHFFAENVGDHITAAVENLLAKDPPFMERAVFYNRLSAASIDRIEEEARRLGGQALLALNEMAHERQANDLEAPDGSHRFRFGVFFYSVDEEAEAGDRNGPPTGPADTGDGDETDDATC